MQNAAGKVFAVLRDISNFGRQQQTAGLIKPNGKDISPRTTRVSQQVQLDKDSSALPSSSFSQPAKRNSIHNRRLSDDLAHLAWGDDSSDLAISPPSTKQKAPSTGRSNASASNSPSDSDGAWAEDVETLLADQPDKGATTYNASAYADQDDNVDVADAGDVSEEAHSTAADLYQRLDALCKPIPPAESCDACGAMQMRLEQVQAQLINTHEDALEYERR